MKKLSTIQNVLLWLGGYDSHTASLCTTSEVSKMCMAGLIVLIPGMVGLFSYGYAFYFVFDSIYVAAIGGLASAFILILIDRALISWSRGSGFDLGKLGRVLFAFTVGFLLAEPMVLRVFESSIIETQEAELRNKFTGIADPFETKKERVVSKLANKEQEVASLRLAYTQEMDGSGGSGIRNQGPIFRQKFDDYTNAKVDLEKLRAESKSELLQIEEEYNREVASISAVQDDGLLGRMRTLHQLGEREPIVSIATWMLRLFFVLIELLPFFLKISARGDVGVYYQIVDNQDNERVEAMAGAINERMMVEKGKLRLQFLEKHLQQSFHELKMVSDAGTKDVKLLIQKSRDMSELKLDTIQEIEETIQDEGLKEKVISQLNVLVDNYNRTLDELINKSNTSYNPQ